MPFGTKKLQWRGYPIVNFFDDMLIRFDTTHERDRQTDRHTETHRHIHRMTHRLRLCIASRGKNWQTVSFDWRLTRTRRLYVFTTQSCHVDVFRLRRKFRWRYARGRDWRSTGHWPRSSCTVVDLSAPGATLSIKPSLLSQRHDVIST